jgi:putative protease
MAKKATKAKKVVKKKTVKKVAKVKTKKPKEKKVASIKKTKVAETEEKPELKGTEVGKITHFFDNIGVAVVEMTREMKVGDKIRIKGATTDFEQTIDSMQIEHQQVQSVKKGDAIGLRVKDRVRVNDLVYLIG